MCLCLMGRNPTSDSVKFLKTSITKFFFLKKQSDLVSSTSFNWSSCTSDLIRFSENLVISLAFIESKFCRKHKKCSTKLFYAICSNIIEFSISLLISILFSWLIRINWNWIRSLHCQCVSFILYFFCFCYKCYKNIWDINIRQSWKDTLRDYWKIKF